MSQVDFDQAPSIDGWTLSYTAKNVSELGLPAEFISDAVQVFAGDGSSTMLQEETTPMPPDDLPPGSIYGSFIDLRSDLEDGTYMAYVMLDNDSEGDSPTKRLVFTVAGGEVTSQQVD